MRPIKSSSSLPGDPFLPNRFIFGDAVDENGLEEFEYMVHTEHPAFICRILPQDLDFRGSGGEGFRSAMLFDEAENVSYYACNDGLTLTDFNFFTDAEPTAGELKKICDQGIATYWKIDEAYKKREAEPLHRLRVLQREAGVADRAGQLACELAEAARSAVDNPVQELKLASEVQSALNGNEPRILTEAQLSLRDAPAARKLLLERARALISLPDVVRPDGSFKPYELWAIPLMYTVGHAGDNWYLPGLADVEQVLREQFRLAPKVALQVSPVLFTHEWLRDSGCQTLVHVAAALDAGEAVAPEEPESMLRRYEEDRQRFLPRLTLNWIVFAVERGALQKAQVNDELLLDALMPVVESAMGSAIDYGEATLFAPQPLWQALSSGVEEYNAKRLMFAAALVEKNIGLAEIDARVEYRPEALAWWLTFHRRSDGEMLTGFAWLVTPDLAPDREAALDELRAVLERLGLSLEPPRDGRH